MTAPPRARYGTWPEVDADGVRCAKWPRDRLGYLDTNNVNGKTATCAGLGAIRAIR
jgi:hypothetical protein